MPHRRPSQPSHPRRTRVCRAAVAVLLALLGAVRAEAQTPGSAPADPLPPPGTGDRVLIVGTKEAAPFALRGPDSAWTGISHELWRRIADELGYRFEIRELPLGDLLDSAAAGRLDAVVAAVTVTPERELELDFTHPFHVSGLAIAVQAEQRGGWWPVLRRFLSGDFLLLVLGLLALLSVVGALVWLVERRGNPEQFGGDAPHGLGNGLWWSAVTMTTVGYGDIAPRTLGGRMLGLVWMFAGLILASSFTAAITTALTVGELQGAVRGPDDLPRVRVGTVASSTSAAYLAGHGLAHADYADAGAALAALRAGEVQAEVYDAPILRHLTSESEAGDVRVLPTTFERQYYGIALPENSPLREPINRVLLQTIDQPEWRGVLTRYLGE